MSGRENLPAEPWGQVDGVGGRVVMGGEADKGYIPPTYRESGGGKGRPLTLLMVILADVLERDEFVLQ